MGLDSLELHLASALQRYSSLQRRAEGHREPSPLVNKLLAASAGGPASVVPLKLRPRERAAMSAIARVTGDANSLRWVIRPRTAGPDDESL